MKKKKQLTKKDKEFIAEANHTQSLGKAVLNTFPVTNEKDIEKIINHQLENPQIIRALQGKIDIDDNLLFKKHSDLLNKTVTRTYTDKETGELITLTTEEMDVTAVTKGLDMAYKLKGMYAPEEHHNVNVNIETRGKNHKEIDKITKKYEDDLKKMFSQPKPKDDEPIS